jgi:phosphatidylinositol alpha-mannosyltransferase
MKIGLICPYNVTLGGGVQEVVFALQQHLSGRGHIVKILTARPARLGKIDRSAMIFVGNAIDLRWPNHTTAPLSSEINPELIDQVLNTEKFDILHFHEPWVPVLSRQILARSHSINIGTFHAKVPETIVNRTLSAVVTPYLRTVLKDLHSMTAVSEPAAEFVSSMTDRPIAIIPNGIELDHFATHNSPQSSIKKILYIGRLPCLGTNRS